MAGRGRPPGQPKTGGGSRKGIPNKLNVDIAAKLAAMGCDPIAGMANIALDTENDLDLRAKMFSELAQYVAPKRKAIEHSGDESLLEAMLARLG
jgi:hypothetical protein